MSKLTLIVASSNQHKMREISMMLANVPGCAVVPFTDYEPLPDVEEDGKTFSENASKKAVLFAKYLYASRGVSSSGRHTSVAADTGAFERVAAARARRDTDEIFGLDRVGPAGSRRVLGQDSQRIRPSDVLVIADDSGIAVDALKGAPGVHSARYAGKHGDDLANNRKLLQEMKDVKDDKRTARFVCAIALASQNGSLFTVEGKVEGRIAREAKGENGFGYDPLFFYPPYKQTFGEVDADAKNAVSHRGNALKLFKNKLMRLLTDEGLV